MSIMQNLFTASVSSFTFVTSATSTGEQITIPSSAQEGDFAILFDAAFNDFFAASIPSTVVPSEFISVENNNSTYVEGIIPAETVRGICSYKILSSSDPNTSINGMTPSLTINTRKILLIFRPDVYISNVEVVSNGQTTGNVSNPSSQAISMSGVSTPIIGVSHYFSSGTINTRGDSSSSMTERSNTTLQYSKHIIYNLNSSPQNITVSINATGNVRGLQSAYFKFT